MYKVPILLCLCLPLADPSRAADSPDEIWEKIAPFFQPPAELANDFAPYKSPLEFYDGTPVKTPADWQKRRQEILKTWHDLLGPWPPVIDKPKTEFLEKERGDSFTQQHLRLEVAPGRATEDAYLLIPDGKGPFPAVVVVFYEAGSGIGKKGKLLDFATQLAKRGFVALSLGSSPETYYPDKATCKLQPLSYHAYEAANCYQALANLPSVDAKRIGIMGHSYGGKWALFASCLFEKFAAAVWIDPGIVFDEKRGNVNYWERWYIGFDPSNERKKPGIPSDQNARTGPYKVLIDKGHDLHELHALMAPRPFLVSGGSEDLAERWRPLNHSIAVSKLLGYENRVAMTNRTGHSPTPESNEQLYLFFEYFLLHGKALK